MTDDEWFVEGDKLDPAEVIGLPRGLIADATRLLAEIERNGPTLSAKDCLRLFASVAELRFIDWYEVEIIWTEERHAKVESAARELYARLRVQAEQHSAPLMASLADGVQLLLESIGSGVARYDQVARTSLNAWEAETSVEFLGEVILPRDEVGFVLELLKDLGIELPPPTAGLVADMDTRLRQWLPAVAEAYRRGGDSIDPVKPEMLPASFWWRRLPGARPTET